jgi:transcriptional regulator with XRE-family HTH domain
MCTVHGRTLKRARKALRLTQVELAKRLGVAGNTVARWERGEVTIPEPVAKLVRLIAPARKGGPPRGRKKET